jgi:hypothetical protein
LFNVANYFSLLGFEVVAAAGMKVALLWDNAALQPTRQQLSYFILFIINFRKPERRRPRCRWEDNFKMCLQGCGVRAQLAQDRFHYGVLLSMALSVLIR